VKGNRHERLDVIELSPAIRIADGNDEFLAREILGHGAYVCLSWRAPGNVPTTPLAHLAGLAERRPIADAGVRRVLAATGRRRRSNRRRRPAGR
jgi:hypothetical protein